MQYQWDDGQCSYDDLILRTNEVFEKKCDKETLLSIIKVKTKQVF